MKTDGQTFRAEQQKLRESRGRSTVRPDAGDHSARPEVAQVFTPQEIRELLARHFSDEPHHAGPLPEGVPFRRSLSVEPHFTLVRFAVFS